MSEFKPKATILFLAYNQEKYVVQAAQSCLNQQGDPIEIIFSDDCSTDSTYSLLEQTVNNYSGPHQVILRQNNFNLGIADHYNVLVKLAQAQLLITAAGDDISYPHRVKTLLAAWEASSCKLDLIASYAMSITYEGLSTGNIIKVDQLCNWKSPKDWCTKRPYVVGATHAFTKKIWLEFGNIAPDIPYEDQIVSFRAVCLGGAHTLQEPLLDYRMGGVSSNLNKRYKKNNRTALYVRHSRQKAVFQQIHKDLIRIGRADLWTGKVKRYLDRSLAVLWLLQYDKFDLNKIRSIVHFGMRCGWPWLFRQIHHLNQGKNNDQFK